MCFCNYKALSITLCKTNSFACLGSRSILASLPWLFLIQQAVADFLTTPRQPTHLSEGCPLFIHCWVKYSRIRICWPTVVVTIFIYMTFFRRLLFGEIVSLHHKRPRKEIVLRRFSPESAMCVVGHWGVFELP